MATDAPRTNPSPIQALIFDFDGLILDTETPDYQSWREIFAAHDAELTMDVWANSVGRPAHVFDPHDYLEQVLGKSIDRFAARTRRMLRFAELIEQQTLLPGVESYVNQAREMGLRLAIASSAPRAWVTHHIERLGIAEYFECIKCAEDANDPKPHPELYLAALGDLDLRPSQAIAFEDSPVGIRAAKLAGIFCVVVPNGVTQELPLDAADLILNSLADMSLGDLLSHVDDAVRRRAAG